METAQIFKISVLAVISFLTAFACTPLLTHFLYKYKLGKHIRDATTTPIFSAMHREKDGTPTMGGIMIWGTTAIIAMFILTLAAIFGPDSLWAKLNFLTRAQTLLPLGALVATAIIGLADDYMNIRRIGPHGGGMGMGYKLILYAIIATVGALWFYFKLDWDVFHIPFVGNIVVGAWYIPIFIVVLVSTAFSVNEIDGLDGLAGGTVAATLTALGAIAFAQGKFDLSAFIAVLIGALVAFLWFNINPARFFMGDTGSMGLGVTIGVIAMLTNTALLLPIIGLLFVIESMSVIIQLLSKKFRGKKVFLSSPIHHHFQAAGWSEPKIVMRFWLISSITAVVGLIVFLADKGWY